MVARKRAKIVPNQTRRQVKILIIVLTNGLNNCVGEYENLYEIEKKSIRGCIDRK